MPTLIANSSGFDLQQIIFVVVFVVIGFVQWVYKLWQEKQEQAKRERQPPPSSEELEARRRARQLQTTGNAPSSSPNRPSPPPMPSSPTPSAPQPQPGGLGDLIETFRKAMEEQQAPRSAPAPPPPPLPTPPQRQVHTPAPPQRSVPAAPVTPLQVEARTAYTLQPAKPAPTNKGFDDNRPVGVAYDAKASRVHPLTEYLRSTGGYRKAFILKEILDAPKALQKSPWPVD
ncbi:hypothetical protein FEM03_23745 [Phragmitibacter flavus]|uniref:Uncharacterized protein n=1 Tax=Phragmitibacter flavus TaxID=2576071 RepID=A0A5R8K780_9BACT|nr:hypothetical protein [Phragmitibacter flavus]TLD68224.1 hypothetical protein FEM03_23745 [Phragmitibacter flavus]